MPQKTKRTLSLVLVITLICMLLTGCSDITEITMNENGSGSYQETVTMSKNILDTATGGLVTDDTIKTYLQNLYPQAEVTISDETADGTESKVIHASMNFKNSTEFQQLLSNREMLSVKFNANYFSRSPIYMPVEGEDSAGSIADDLQTAIGSNDALLEAAAAELKNLQVKMTITFPYAVTKTNGTVQEDGKTVVWDMQKLEDASRLYAVFQETNSLKAPEFNGAKDGKYYNTGVTIKVDSENLIDYVDVDGQKIESDYLFLSEESAYHIKAADVNGNISEIRFRIDTTKPAVSGAVNGKTYKSARTIRFSDKGSGIKKAVLNGKTIKSGKTVSKKGSYTLTVTDKAGNKKTVKFKIK